MTGDRARFATGWGVVLTTAGAAVGLGNIWRFPYMMGQYGGSAFLVLYLLLVIAFGLPGLMAEIALGRHTQRGPAGAFHRAGMPGATAWTMLLIVTMFMAPTYYGVVLGRVLGETAAFGLAAAGGADAAPGLGMQGACTLITIAVSCAAVGLGVRRGIERWSTIGLPFFFVLFVGIILYVLRLEGAMDGLREFLVPRLDQVTPQTPVAALGQAFFSLGLAGTLMVTYGSYLRPGDSIPRIAVGTAGADVGAALLAGMIVVPAVFAVGVPLDGGPALMFAVLPAVFQEMPAGAVVGTLFFAAVFVVGVLSLIAAYEVLVIGAVDVLGWTRVRAAAVLGAGQVVLGVPALLSDSYIGYSDLVWGTTMMPVGSALAVVALAWCVGRAKALEEIGRRTRLPVTPFLFVWIKYVLPAGIAVMLVYGWIDWLRQAMG